MIEQLKMLKCFLISIATDLSEGKPASDDLYMFFIAHARREIVNLREMINDLGFSDHIAKIN